MIGRSIRYTGSPGRLAEISGTPKEGADSWLVATPTTFFGGGSLPVWVRHDTAPLADRTAAWQVLSKQKRWSLLGASWRSRLAWKYLKQPTQAMDTKGQIDCLNSLSRALPVVLCLCLPCCRDSESLAKIARLEQQRATLEQQLAREKELRRTAEEAKAVIENKVDEANARSAQREKSLQEHLKLAERLKAKLRTAAVGEEMPKLATKSGNVYENAKILQVSDEDLTVAHSRGVTVIPYGDLPEIFVERFEMADRRNSASGHSTEVPPLVQRWMVGLLALGLVLCAYSIFCATGKARPIWVLLPIAVIGAGMLWICVALWVGGAAHKAEDNLSGDRGSTVSIGGGESRILRESSK